MRKTIVQKIRALGETVAVALGIEPVSGVCDYCGMKTRGNSSWTAHRTWCPMVPGTPADAEARFQEGRRQGAAEERELITKLLAHPWSPQTLAQAKALGAAEERERIIALLAVSADVSVVRMNAHGHNESTSMASWEIRAELEKEVARA